MKLIAGYLHPESGSISVLGNPLDTTALKSYYPHIGYLTQDPSVFDATIRENLVSALPSLQRGMSEGQGDLVSEQNPQSLRDSSFTKELTEQKLIKALKLAHCDFVFDLEHGLDTEIGERGVRLSG
jgi:ABC-type multidrug transport system fused ATPase/permease subunit